MNKYLLTVTAFAMALGANAQQNAPITAKDYERAEAFLGYNTSHLVDRANVSPNWLPGDKFWYSVSTAQGNEFILVDPAKKTRTTAFDSQKLAAALSTASGKTYDANKLPFQSIGYSADGKSVLFSADAEKWAYNPATNQVTADTSKPVAGKTAALTGRAARGGGNEVMSPDRSKAVFIKDYNLWVRDVASGKQTQLTTDGVKDFGYATDNAGWTMSDRPIVSWSPDSKKVATFQQDQRKVSDMYLVTTNVGKPTLMSWKYPLPGEKDIVTIQRVIIDVENPKIIRFNIAPDPHRATLSDDIASSGSFDDADWKADGSEFAFVSTSRDHKNEKFRIANATTGAVREVFEETVKTQYESGWGAINWRYLPTSKEIIWFSERDNWGHLYLYDATTGKLKNQITKGDFAVTKLLKVDEKTRTLYFAAGGREPGNPYFSHFYKIGFNGKGLTLLTPETGNHNVNFSPNENYFVDSYSQPDVPPVTVLRDMKGNLLATLEKTDVSRLAATGWKAPAPVKLKAHDGTTDIYGLVFTPTKMEAGKKYPVIDYIYPGPQGGGVGSWSFIASRGDHQALAELGFIVVVIEGTSNPLRSKSFHDMSYGNMGDNTLPDQITGIKQLAAKYPIDTTKVGIWGHSGGGFATATAMFKYPDFFKVGISESGNHENRNYEDDWGERYNGLVENSNYDAQANQNFAKNLKGKLMLAHGMMDNNVPPYNTLLVAEALEKANKSFDLVIFPNSAHGYGQYSYYMMRRRWDYFVKNLLGAEPPYDYVLGPKSTKR
ncbi:DPP IV N-terminal domain-containing protein [Mucilaginibacter sp. 5C4]|uniref:S9 family peptidase n=1 Tax=Mucilaginibacter sp. 5C4 TaxID=3048589 RepID=UPI002AC9ED3C|nr:DPP IV N-terminal domain-containing protein [Mucilaginibacter sp. 5C4]MEB0299367.1 DPP IV N-terminal domain-containing protein [Mucilaginibacter sp. 5C4]WPX23390.1 DPP IV N-terminal domain-containing protein [Mucilaginibacter sp. 5C4]